jgi:hypothetical protein
MLGISLSSPVLRADGQVELRPATITPFFEEAELEARKCLEGLIEDDMSLEDQAVQMTVVISDHLGRQTVFDPQGQVAEWLAPNPDLPGGPTAPVARTLG